MLKAPRCTISRFAIVLAVAMLAFPGSEATQAWSQDPTKALQQVWSVQIEQLVKEPPGWMAVSHHKTGRVAFSPDDKRLAVTLGHGFHVSGSSEHDNTHLMIIDRESPEANVTEFDLPGTCDQGLAWSPSGDALLVCGTLLRLADRATCVAGDSRYHGLSGYGDINTGFWFDTEHVIRPSGTILDLACKEVGAWQMPANWRILLVAPSKAWILLSRSAGDPGKSVCDITIVERTSNHPLSGWPRLKSHCSTNPMFAPGAEALCYNSQGYSDKLALHCWGVNGTKEISSSRKFRDYLLNQTAIDSSLVVVDRWAYDHWDWLGLAPAVLRRRAIFDLRSGNEIVSWKPRLQQAPSPDVVDRPYQCALASDGAFLAESGDGGLELYRIAR